MKKWIVALSVGGIMGMPEIEYNDFQIIEANDENGSEKEYNRINSCNYFYGHCLGEATKLAVDMINKLYPKAKLVFDNYS